MALRPTTSNARAWLVSRAEVARATTPRTPSGCRIAQVSAWCPPSEPPTTASSWLMPELVQQAALHLHHIANGDGREIAAVGLAGGGVDAAGAGGAAAAAQQIGADDEVAAGVNRLARADRDIPPAGVVLLVMLGNMGVSADGVADQDRVVLRGVEFAVSLVGDGDAVELAAEFQVPAARQVDRPGMPQRLGVRTVSLLSNTFLLTASYLF